MSFPGLEMAWHADTNTCPILQSLLLVDGVGPDIGEGSEGRSIIEKASPHNVPGKTFRNQCASAMVVDRNTPS